MTSGVPDNSFKQLDHDRADISTLLLAGASCTAQDLALCSREEARSLIPSSQAVALGVLPLVLQSHPSRPVLHVAASSSDSNLRRKIRFIAGVEAIITVVSLELLHDAIHRAYFAAESHLERHLQLVTAPKIDAAPVVARECAPKPHGDAAQFITALLEYSSARGASDLHLAPGPQGAIIKLRIDGDISVVDGQPCPIALHEQVVSRLKVLAKLDIAQRRIPQDGSFTFTVGSVVVNARLSTLPSVFGESAVVRFLREKATPDLQTLGFESNALRVIRETISLTEGLILLTGPTGSGKTTTMYSLLSELERRGRNVVTVEDPVESRLPGVVQVQVSLEQGLDYPRAIRSVLRHDPDALLIGEMRDGVSASIGLDAASTGHLTLSSLHIGSSLHVFTRMEALGVPSARVVPALSLVVNQRLVAKLCSACKVAVTHEEKINLGALYLPQGCSVCRGSGYSGRVLVTEVLDLRSKRAKESCYRARRASDLVELLPGGAFISWAVSLRKHLADGSISVAQVEEFVKMEEL